jgi:hypothetical protein
VWGRNALSKGQSKMLRYVDKSLARTSGSSMGVQELLVSTKALFYDREWRLIGDRKERKERILAVTKIKSTFIDGSALLSLLMQQVSIHTHSCLSLRASERRRSIFAKPSPGSPTPPFL